MHLKCKDCGEEILAEDMNLDTIVAKCRACNAVFRFCSELDAEGVVAAPPPPLKVPMPRGIAMDRSGAGLAIVRRWFSPKVLFLEQEMESYLGIQDRRVPGEYGK